MKKFLIISVIFFLIFFTAFIKNSTKRIDDLIFSSEENLRALSKNFENIKLEYDFLSSTERLLQFQNKYFEEELIIKKIQNIKIINKSNNDLNIENLRFNNAN
tara:strand:- start:2265 stop:2573 length:309 start_codon:yes stop_codon:yes gene_type:complete